MALHVLSSTNLPHIFHPHLGYSNNGLAVVCSDVTTIVKLDRDLVDRGVVYRLAFNKPENRHSVLGVRVEVSLFHPDREKNDNLTWSPTTMLLSHAAMIVRNKGVLSLTALLLRVWGPGSRIMGLGLRI
eukprot:2128637-Rhodomonas_salina.3